MLLITRSPVQRMQTETIAAVSKAKTCSMKTVFIPRLFAMMNEEKQSAFCCRKKSKQEEEQLRRKIKKEFRLAEC